MHKGHRARELFSSSMIKGIVDRNGAQKRNIYNVVWRASLTCIIQIQLVVRSFIHTSEYHSNPRVNP